MPRRTLRNSHQTTLRFTEEMWGELEHAAAGLGVSIAQYVRDAARARLAGEAQLPARAGDSGEAVMREVERRNAFEHSYEHVEHSAALWHQGRLARDRARLLREEAQSRRQRVS